MVNRLPNNPIIRPNMDNRMGDNINGPSLIKVPSWIKNPLGKYYLYFASHIGKYIRLAFSDNIEGEWKTYEHGTLQIAQTIFSNHIAFPDVHIDNERHQIWMYYHGASLPQPPHQFTCLAVSNDGINFVNNNEVIGTFYWRVFSWNGYYCALSMPGKFYRSKDGITNFEEGPTLFTEHMRHSAVRVEGDELQVFYTNAHDCPERILRSRIRLTPDWKEWKASEPEVILEPETDYEGGSLPLEPSKRGMIDKPAKQLRDPALYEEDGKIYLLYSVAGESGIAVGEIRDGS